MGDSAIIFDLDQTLVDSSLADGLRSQRRWRDVYGLIPRFALYPGVAELWGRLQSSDCALAVVTNSPRSYCERVLAHFKLSVAACVCYHDTKQHKPHPAPFRLVLDRLGVSAPHALSVGDQPNDIIASHGAGVTAIGVTWGGGDAEALRSSGASVVCSSVPLLVARLLGGTA